MIKLVSAPNLRDERKARTARLTNRILLATLASAFVFLIIGTIFSAESRLLIILSSLGVILSMLVIKAVLHGGNVKLAAILLSLVIWISFSTPIFVYDGIRDVAVTGYFIVIIMAGLMLDSRSLLAFTALTHFSVIIAFFAEKTGIIVSSITPSSSPVDLVVILTTLGASSLLTGVAMNLLTNTYERARRNEAAITRTNLELKAALAKVKTLGGLLPLCSHCKKIRDDKGYWNQIDAYIEAHSDADISHSICPECAQKYYADMNLYDQ